MPSGGVEIVFLLQNKIIEFFEEKRAYDCEHAISLKEIEVSTNCFRFLLIPCFRITIRKLLRYGVLRKCPDGNYFLVKDAVSDFKKSFKRFLPF